MPVIKLDLDSTGAVSGLKKYELEAKKAGTATDKLANSGSKFDNLKGAIGGLHTKFMLLSTVVATVAGSVGVAFAKMAVQAASSLEETQGKFDVVFKGMTSSAESWARGLQQAYGMSEDGAKKALSSFQDILVPMGMTREAAGQMSNSLTRLAVDLGSFNNIGTEKVMEDMKSAMVGNYETMKKYGVVLSATRVEQEVMNQGWAKSKDEITQTMKMQAAFNIMVASSTDAIGDFNRTQDSFANQMKIAKEKVSDLVAQLGQKLLPAATKMVSTFVQWISKQENVNRVINASITAVQFLVDGFNGLKVVFHAVIAGFGIMANFIAEGLSKMLTPLKLVFDGLMKIGLMDFNPVRTALDSLTSSTKMFADSAVDGLNRAWDSALKTSEGFNKMKVSSKSAADTIKPAMESTKQTIDQVQQSFGQLTDSTEQNSQASDMAAQATEMVAQATEQASSAVENMASSLSEVSYEASSTASEYENLTVATQELASAQAELSGNSAGLGLSSNGYGTPAYWKGAQETGIITGGLGSSWGGMRISDYTGIMLGGSNRNSRSNPMGSVGGMARSTVNINVNQKVSRSDVVGIANEMERNMARA